MKFACCGCLTAIGLIVAAFASTWLGWRRIARELDHEYDYTELDLWPRVS